MTEAERLQDELVSCRKVLFAAGQYTAELLQQIALLKAQEQRLLETAESAYWTVRGRLDQIPGWVHGDDGPCYPLIAIVAEIRRRNGTGSGGDSPGAG